MKNKIYKLIEEKCALQEYNVLGIYLFGSRTYGTNGKDSDYDYIVINDGLINDIEITDELLNIHIYSAEYFQELLNIHDIKAFEIFFLHQSEMEYNGFIFNLDKGLLRNSISKKANNSWVKCKKKLTVEKNQYNIGIKSLFHAFRIIDFGIQIATNGKISNYRSSNYIWDELKTLYNANWDSLEAKYRILYNNSMSEFRKHAPKNKILNHQEG